MKDLRGESMENKFLLTCIIKDNNISTYMWFDNEEELKWTIKNNTAIEPIKAYEIKNAREINI